MKGNSNWTASEGYVFRGVDLGMTLEDIQVAPPRVNEVMLEVAACGACHSDLHKIEGHGTVAPPCVFGHEISGTVIAIGADVTDLPIGTRVVCAFLAPCGQCAACFDGRDDECTTFRQRMQREGLSNAGQIRYLDSDGDPLRGSGIAGLVRQVVLPRDAVFALPDAWPEEISLASAAVLGCAALTAFGAIRRGAQFESGSTALVLAAGGIGLCIVRLLRHLGASEIIVSDVRDEALEAARLAGATLTLRADDPDFAEKVRERAGNGGVDRAFDTLGMSATLNQAISVTRIGGRIVMSGLAGAGSPLGITDSNDFVRRKLELVGSYAARPSIDMPDLLQIVANGGLDPRDLISERYPFSAANEAYASLARGGVTGRALIDYHLSGELSPIQTQRSAR